MNKRLQQFLSAEGITQSEFADRLGVARASISHILAGRNKPGFDFLQSLLKHYPTLSIEWLISGKGKMYQSAAKPSPAEPIQQAVQSQGEEAGVLFPSIPQGADNTEESATESIPSRLNAYTKGQAERKAAVGTAKRIQNIIVLYEDGTFQYLL